ncbi:MAG: PAS domain-containing protein [Oscillochloridaceae bacterium umkhey_bin13]
MAVGGRRHAGNAVHDSATTDYLVWPAPTQTLVARVGLAMHRQMQQTSTRPTAPTNMATRLPATDQIFRVAFDHLPTEVMIVAPTNQIEYVNPAFSHFTGYSPHEMIGRQPGFLVLPEDHAATVARGHLLAAGQIDHFVHERRRYVRKDGSFAFGKLTVYAPRDKAGHPMAFLAFIEDMGSRI